MKKRYFCELAESDEGKELLVNLTGVFYFIGIIISIIYFLIIGELNIGTFFVSALILGNLGWMAYLLVILPVCNIISSIHKNIDNLLL